MDLLFNRYASPFSLLDHMIENGSLSDFIEYAWEANEEKNQWEFYLNKHSADQSFEEFKSSIKETAANQKMSKAVLETTVIDSMTLLENFIPE